VRETEKERHGGDYCVTPIHSAFHLKGKLRIRFTGTK